MSVLGFEKVYNMYFIIFFMDELALLKKRLDRQERRIKKLEAEVYDDSEDEELEESGSVNSASESEGAKSNISFNQIITILGIVGISIGIISFFFYAIAQGWIGRGLQVAIGVLTGFILFFVAYALRKNNEVWSNIVFGGAYFVEYLSLGVAVSVYEIMPAFIGVGFGALVLVSSIALCFKLSSRAIAYFSLIGGFLIPIITDTFQNYLFVMVWYLLLVVALSFISVSFNWSELRGVMLFFITIFVWNTFSGTGNAEPIEFLFLGLYFLLFNISSLVNSVFNKNKMSSFDSLILGILPILFLPLLYEMMNDPSGKTFGFIVILFSFIYLFEVFVLKSRGFSHESVLYSLIAAGVAVLNFGIYFLFNDIFDLEFFIIFFIVEWALFSYLASDEKGEFYKTVSFVFLALVALWFVSVLRFNEGVYHASFFIIILLAVPVISLIYFKSNINYKINAAIFIISGYAFLYSFFKYLWFFLPSNSLTPIREIILSVLWLVYTLVLFVQVQTREGKLLVGFLLGFTLMKIAFKDLLYLDGAFRIVGFILFGVLLLIGGYFLGNEKK